MDALVELFESLSPCKRSDALRTLSHLETYNNSPSQSLDVQTSNMES